MRRIIKFKAWDSHRNEMFYPSQIHPIFQSDSWGMPRYTGDDPSDTILMQFTGITDKNGKEIYEGDIIKYDVQDFHPTTEPDTWTEYTEEVVFRNGGFEVDAYPVYMAAETGEVIGNIYENPRLFELCTILNNK
jgi:uncharacterized phage protein (TIGR01671 family)